MSGARAPGVTGASTVTPSGTFGLWPRVRDDRLFFGLIGGLVVLAWLSLWLWQQSPYARFLGHEEIGGTASMARAISCCSRSSSGAGR